MKTAVQTIEVREAILDATDDFLARYGYKKMTIDDLAQAMLTKRLGKSCSNCFNKI